VTFFKLFFGNKNFLFYTLNTFNCLFFGKLKKSTHKGGGGHVPLSPNAKWGEGGSIKVQKSVTYNFNGL